MDKNRSVSIIMKKHHGQLERLLNKLNKSEDSYNLKLQLFNKFKWELEKHFFLEEKAIFFYIDNEQKEIIAMKSRLMKEHDTILEELGKVELDLKNKNDLDTATFRILLLKHKKFEDETFYPTLDKELDESKKMNIMDRISNPI